MKYNKQLGYSLVELSIGLVILGIISLAIVKFGFKANEKIEQIEAPNILLAADKALIGYIAAKHRLPCPDVTGDGREDCDVANVIGKLPVVDLGLARADLINVRYGVFNHVATPTSADVDIDLTAKNKDRFFPLLTNIPGAAGIAPSAVTLPLGAANGIDFCHALRMSVALPRDSNSISTALHIRSANNVALKNVAYAISLPSSLSDPATNINNVPYAFASPNSPIKSGSQDAVIAMDFGQIFDRLSCAGVLNSSGHAYPNTASAAAIMRGAMLDYKVQLDLQLEMAELGVLSAGVGVAAAIGALASSTSELQTGISESIATFGGMSAAIGLSAAAMALSIGSTVTAGIGLDSAIETKKMAQARVKEFSGSDSTSKRILEDSGTLASAIRAKAIAADAAGLYR